MQATRKAMLLASRVTDEFDPLDWFIELKQEMPHAYMLGLAVPRLCSEKLLTRWQREQRAKVGICGWTGASYECDSWTKGEAYLKLRSALDEFEYDPFFMAPNGAMSNELWAVLYGMKIAPVGPAPTLLTVPEPNIQVLPYEVDFQGTNRYPVGIGVTAGTNLDALREQLIKAQAKIKWVDPFFAVVNSPGVVQTRTVEVPR